MGLTPRTWEDISPTYKDIQDFIDNFKCSDFADAKSIEKYLSFFGLNDVLLQKLDADRIPTKENEVCRSVSARERTPFAPDRGDLARLHWIVLHRKVLTALEFGSGYSTATVAHALNILASHFKEWASENIRADSPFHLYSIEEEQWYADVTAERLRGGLEEFVTMIRSSVRLILHDNRIATVYSRLPNVCPDFVYVDGPSQFATTEEINGISLGHKCRMPMSADLLLIEFFLEPGTLIMFDGRTANARFVKAYLRRDWTYQHDSVGDVHYFELKEKPLGGLNRLKMEFCLGNAE